MGGRRPGSTSSSATPPPTVPGPSGLLGSWRWPGLRRCYRPGTSGRAPTSSTKCSRRSSRPTGPSLWSLLNTSARSSARPSGESPSGGIRPARVACWCQYGSRTLIPRACCPPGCMSIS